MIASQEETTTVGLGGSVGEEEPGISSRVAVEVDIHEGHRARVYKVFYTGIDLTSTPFYYFFSAWSLRHSALVFWILVEVIGTTYKSLLASIHIRALSHNSVINTGKGRDV